MAGGGGGKGPAQLTAMAIGQLRQAFIFSYNNKDYNTAAFWTSAMGAALPKEAERFLPDKKPIPAPPRIYDQAGKSVTQDNRENFASFKVKPWIDIYYPVVEHALSEYIDAFYKNNPKLLGLY